MIVGRDYERLLSPSKGMFTLGKTLNNIAHRISRSLCVALIAVSSGETFAQPSSAGVAQASQSVFAYQPSPVVGTIRISGSELAGLILAWEEEFRRFQPGIRFGNNLLSGDAAIGALESGAADIAANGREPVLTEYLSFAEVFSNDGPFQVRVATGSYRVLGRTWAQVIYVNKDNPLREISMEQIDKIFGSARTGTYAGYKWRSDFARGPETNIRTWGQLGLAGVWAQRAIQTYGYAPTGMSNFFEVTVFHGGTKWNENLRQFIETGAKQATEHIGTVDEMMDELQRDKFGVAWAGVEHGIGKPGVRMLPIRPAGGSEAIACTPATVADRTYPLTRSIFLQLNRPLGTSLEPKIREFLRFVLSSEGQEIVRRQGEYLPLPPEEIHRQLDALN